MVALATIGNSTIERGKYIKGNIDQTDRLQPYTT
jgi:hypothetical protein